MDARLKRVFKIDIESCPDCGGRLRVIVYYIETYAFGRLPLYVSLKFKAGEYPLYEQDRTITPANCV